MSELSYVERKVRSEPGTADGVGKCKHGVPPQEDICRAALSLLSFVVMINDILFFIETAAAYFFPLLNLLSRDVHLLVKL